MDQSRTCSSPHWPVSLAFRTALAAIVFAPIAAWECGFGGGMPAISEQTVIGGEARGDRSSRDLQEFLQLGHMCDLGLQSGVRLLKAFARSTQV